MPSPVCIQIRSSVYDDSGFESSVHAPGLETQEVYRNLFISLHEEE